VTIDNENNITACAKADEVAQAGDSTTMSFDSLVALNKVSADWQMSRFVEIWNSIPYLRHRKSNRLSGLLLDGVGGRGRTLRRDAQTDRDEPPEPGGLNK